MICLIGYGAGNIASVSRAINHLSYDYTIAESVEEIPKDVSTIILPGVGDGSYMMSQLEARNYTAFLKQWSEDAKPLLGICVGAQVLLSFTKEGNSDCLDIIQGTCKSFYDIISTQQISEGLKIPHIGWNNIEFTKDDMLFYEIPNHTQVYFVHSYFLSVDDPQCSYARTNYGAEFSSIIGINNTIGTQFHPEKSGKWGLKLIDNFLKYYGKETKVRK